MVHAGWSNMSLDLKRPYDHRRWRRLSKQQLDEHPLCCMCLQSSVVEPAVAADHVQPHHGDPVLFWFGTLQSLCASHHNGTKRQLELRGYNTDIGIDGWPKDRNHPVHVVSKKCK